MLSLTGIPQYYNFFSAQKNYKSLIFLASRGVQSQEFNEFQDILNYNTKSLFDAVFKSGALLVGGAISISGNQSVIDEGQIYASGRAVYAPKNTVQIEIVGECVVGMIVNYAVITAEADPELYDSAVGTSNQGYEGAYRLRVVGRWALSTAPLAVGEEFYPVYTLLNGAIKGSEPTPTETQFAMDLIAKYDRAANGSYVAEGMNLSYASYDEVDNFYTFYLQEGVAHVDGYRIVNNLSRSIPVPGLVDVRQSTSEPFTYSAGTNIYFPRFKNIKQISRLIVVKEKTVNVTHGAATNSADLLPNSPVISILEVKQGGTTYTQGSDYSLNGDFISWSPAGLEPAPQSTYSVKFRYQEVITSIAPSVNRDSFSVAGVTDLADGQVMQLDYEYFLSRVDSVVLKKNGDISILKGNPDYYSPQPPTRPQAGLALANITLTYGANPVVSLQFYKAYRMSDVQYIDSAIAELRYNVARLSLLDQVKSTDPTTNKLNTFADPLLDGSVRDMGQTQTLVIADQTLNLPVSMNISTLSAPNGKKVQLPFSNEMFFDQSRRSGKRKINEFLNAAQPPAILAVNPSTYTYMSGQVQLADIVTGWGNSRRFVGTQVGQQALTTPQVLPQLPLTLNGDLFAFNEQVEIKFDGKVIATIPANAQGKLVNQVVTTPNGALSGPKLITARGLTSGMMGEAIFTSNPYLKTLQNVYNIIQVDPIAETILNKDQRFVTALNLMFATLPAAPVTVYITRTQVGLPDRQDVVAKKVISPAQIQVGNVWTTVQFDDPIFLDQQEYAIVLTSTESVGEVRVAKLGAQDDSTGLFITRKPNPDGVLLNSANGSTWSPIQNEDMTLQIFGANFQNSASGIYGQVNVTNATDLMLAVDVLSFPGTFVGFSVTLLDRADETHVVYPGTPIQFATYTGRVRVNWSMTSSNPRLSPQIAADMQVIWGAVSTTGEYSSREFKVSGNTLVAYVDELKDSNGSVTVFYKNSVGWQPMTRDTAGSSPTGDSRTEVPFRATMSSLTNSQTAIRIVQSTTNVLSRPTVKNIRAYVAA